MKKKKTMLIMVMAAMVSLSSCTDWGQSDAPAGNQKLAAAADTSAKLLAELNFENGFNLNDSLAASAFALDGGSVPSIVACDNSSVGAHCAHLTNGYIAIPNPLLDSTKVTGISVVMWVKLPTGNRTGALLSMLGTAKDSLFFTGNNSLMYEATGYLEVNNPAKCDVKDLTDGDWHAVGISATSSGFQIFYDGILKYDAYNHWSMNSGATRSSALDYSSLLTTITTSPYIYIGYGGREKLDEAYISDVKIYKNAITASDVPAATVSTPKPVWRNTFESGVSDCSIIGSGSIVSASDARFGKIFQNVGGAQRTNYLLLPADVLSHSTETKQMSISVWVNATNAGGSSAYMWAPLFTAYGAAPSSNTNTFPMLACQYRGVLQVNCSGWSDFTDAQNTKGANTLYQGDTDWLKDDGWHLYTAVFSGENGKVYIDGVLANEWNMDGSTNTVMGLYSNGADLKYVCLGGNQAWSWGDNDFGAAFDDVSIYNTALTADQIKNIMSAKMQEVELPTPVYSNSFEDGVGTCSIIGSGSITSDADSHFGKVFQNIGGAQRTNYLLLPEDALSHSATSKQLSIGVWVNATNAGGSSTYLWAPLFMAYGAAPSSNTNTFPMLACQYRGVLQVNCSGWSDFTDAQNTNGANTLYQGDTDWLKDNGWHYYCAVFSGENGKVYLDGALANEWNMDGSTNTIMGLYSNGADLKYVCLGGNQAWSWGDNDFGAAFDDVAIYNTALTATQIKAIMNKKTK